MTSHPHHTCVVSVLQVHNVYFTLSGLRLNPGKKILKN
eukprot:NP_001155930.1 sniffer isoform 2 [Acyrthosiphon pisum]